VKKVRWRIGQAVEAQFALLGSISFTGEALATQAAAWLGLIAASVMPVALTALVIGSTAGLVQTDFLFAPKRISLRADKLNPLEGLKRIFSLSGLVEAAKGSLKVIIVALIVYQVYNSHKIELLSYQQGITPELSQAQVVVTNPTHVAVALMYQAEQMDAPVVVAKGRGAVAARIRKLATTYGIPIAPEPAVARALYDAVSLGRPVPPVLYQAVAEILASIYRAAAERRARRLALLLTSSVRRSTTASSHTKGVCVRWLSVSRLPASLLFLRSMQLKRRE
jgi:flagellar biosynthesis protein FlhB